MKKRTSVIVGTAVVLALGSMTACGAVSKQIEPEVSQMETEEVFQSEAEETSQSGINVDSQNGTEVQQTVGAVTEQAVEPETRPEIVVTMEETSSSEVIRMAEDQVRTAAETRVKQEAAVTAYRNELLAELREHRTPIEDLAEFNWELWGFSIFDLNQDGIYEMLVNYGGSTIAQCCLLFYYTDSLQVEYLSPGEIVGVDYNIKD